MRAAVGRAAAARTEIVLDRDNFPTDRYVADGVARECGLTLRWIDVDTVGRGDRRRCSPRPSDRADRAGRAQPRRLPLGLPRRRRRAHPDRPRRRRAGALGPVPLRRLGAGRARRLGASTSRSAAPTSTSTAAPARRPSATSRPGTCDELTQPIQGWMGAADPFLMGPVYAPAAGIRRFLSGTPPIVGMLALQDMVELIDEVGIGRRPREVGRAHRVRHRAGRRAAGAAGRDGRLAARPGAARRPRDAHAPVDAGGDRARSGSGT